MPDDPSATLAGIRERAEQAAPALAVRRGLNSMADSAEDVPRLLAAVEKALELHQPKPLYALAASADYPDLCDHAPDIDTDAHFEADDGLWYCSGKITGQVCRECADEDVADLWAEWPCPTYRAIRTALAGEEDGDEH